MSLLKFTAKRVVAMFIVLIAVVLITSLVVSWNIEMSLEQRIRQEVIKDIAKTPSLCYDFSSIEACVDYYVRERMGKISP